jgi:hypothetical protein
MFQLPPIPDVAARLNQMRQSATLAPIQQAQQQRGQVFQPSLPRGGGNGLAQGAAGLGEGLKTVAAVLKERKEEEAAGAFVDDFLQKYGPQSQTVPASFADGPTGDNVQQMAATKPATSAPFGFTTDAMAMLGTLPKREAAQLIQHRMVTWKPEKPERTKTGEAEIIWEHGAGRQARRDREGVDKLTVPSPQTQIAKIRLDARNNLITPEDADAQIRVLQMEGQPLDREALKRFGFRPGTVAYWKDGAPHVAQAPEATEKPVPGRDVPYSQEVFDQKVEQARAGGTQINMGDKADAALIKADVKQLESAREAVGRLGELQSGLGVMKSLLEEGVQTGKAAPVRLLIGQMAGAIGIDIAGTSEMELFQQIQDKLVPAMRVPGSGSTSDFEGSMFVSAIPNLSRTTEGNQKIVYVLGKMIDYQMQNARLMENYFYENKTLRGYNEYRENKIGASALSKEDISYLKSAAGKPAASDLPAGSIEAMSLADLTQLDRNSMSKADLQRLIARARQLKASGGGS